MLFSKKAQEGVTMAILGIVAVIAVVGLVLLFAGGATGKQIEGPTACTCTDAGGPNHLTHIIHPIGVNAPEALQCAFHRDFDARIVNVGGCDPFGQL